VGIRGAWTGYVWLRGAKRENENLRERVRQLTLREDSFAEIEAENARLRQLLSFKQGRSLETIGAKVIGRTPDYLASIVYVDRGSSDGVRMGQAVLADKGVFGRVVLVTSHTSQVQLITNVDAAVGARVERTRSPGVLNGTGDRVLELNYINNSEQVEPNDLIVTSGLDGVFPTGLALGRVVESRKGNSVFRLLRVAPLADLLHVEEVLILLTPSEPARN
jgi:rod shape-determining protein MreC